MNYFCIIYWIQTNYILYEYNIKITLKNHHKKKILLRKMDSNHRPLGYEPSELPLLHSTIFSVFEKLNGMNYIYDKNKFYIHYV